MEGNQDVSNSLITAVREGNLERARELINRFGLSHSQAWSEGYNLLCTALENNHAAVAKLLLESGSEVNSKNSTTISPSDTPLHFAVENGDIEIVKMILDRGADTNAKSRYDRTPLHYAIANGNIEVTELLLKYKADVNASDNYGTTPLHNAIANKNVEITELLLKYKADANASDKYGTRPIHAAVQIIGCLQIVEHLLRYGADVNYVNIGEWRRGYAALHFAVEKGYKEVITLLLSKGANVDFEAEDYKTPLHIAAQEGFGDIAEDLLNHCACINSCTVKERYTPLHFASERGNEEVVKLLLKKGADVNANTNDNLTPLHIATITGREAVVKLLLEHGAKVDHQDKDGKTPLHFAVEKGYLTIVNDLLKYCPDINNRSNRSSLKIAVEGCGEEYKKIVEALLEYGFNVEPEDANNPELLHAAVKKGYLKIVEDLLKNGADVHTKDNSRVEEGLTPLHSAAKNQQEEVAKLLISNGADTNAQDISGKTPIFHAITNADVKITNLLLTNGANIKDCPDLLNIAVQKGCIEVVEALLQHDADINASDKYGRTALHFTALYGRSRDNIKGEIAKLLLSRGADVDAQTGYGETVLYAAIRSGHAKVVKTLLKYNANVNSRTKGDIIPLHLSVECRNKKISMMLLTKGANVNEKQEDGRTALHLAVGNGDKAMVKLLLKCGANIDSKMDGDVTPLHISAQIENPQEISTLLLNKGANVNTKRDDGMTALHIAVQDGPLKLVVTLLEYGSDINIVTENNLTPLGLVMTLFDDYDDDRYYDQDPDDDEDPYDDDDEDPYDDDDDDPSDQDGDEDPYDDHHSLRSYKRIAKALKHHVVKMKIADLYVSENNLLSVSSNRKISDFQGKCEKEMASMKSKRINNLNISFYDILAKSTSSLALCMRNENIVQVLKSDDYKTNFPIYASMIKSQFRKGMERKKLLEQGNKLCHLLFNYLPELPYDCMEKILTYLSNEDLRNLMDAHKPLSISNPIANINDAVTTVQCTSNIFQEEPPFKIRKIAE